MIALEGCKEKAREPPSCLAEEARSNQGKGQGSVAGPGAVASGRVEWQGTGQSAVAARAKRRAWTHSQEGPGALPGQGRRPKIGCRALGSAAMRVLSSGRLGNCYVKCAGRLGRCGKRRRFSGRVALPGWRMVEGSRVFLSCLDRPRGAAGSPTWWFVAKPSRSTSRPWRPSLPGRGSAGTLAASPSASSPPPSDLCRLCVWPAGHVALSDIRKVAACGVVICIALPRPQRMPRPCSSPRADGIVGTL